MRSQQEMTAIGTMSGTSMDGVDVALLRTDGTGMLQSLGHASVAYSLALQTQLKQMAAACALTQGDMAQAQRQVPGWYDALVELMQCHRQAIEQLIAQTAVPVDVIGFHGQTLYHAPHQQKTIQVGDGKALQQAFGCPVVHQFRLQDVAAGGQGAPLAPAYHQALVLRDQLAPAVVINCGGISNVTMVQGAGWQQVRAADIGPGNGLIDRYVAMVTDGQQHYDRDGQIAGQGQLDQALLEWLWQHAVINDTQTFFERPWPKSLDSHDLSLPNDMPMQGQAMHDACFTLTYFTADMLIKSLMTQDFPSDCHVILAGGGWCNPVLLRCFRQLMAQAFPQSTVHLAEQVGWCSAAVEAEIFAYLAVRRLLQLPASGPYTTGCQALCVAGEIVE